VSTLERLRRLLAEVLRIDESQVMPDSSIAGLFERSGDDSLDRVELVLAIEEEFGDLKLSDEDAADWEVWILEGSVRKLAEFIDRRRSPPT
jgi:acyl carrier protein